MDNLQIEDRVKHDYSETSGTITGKRFKKPYRFRVLWDGPEFKEDWYEERVLEKIVKYGAVGEEGCEFTADTAEEVQAWIDLEIAGECHADEPVDPDYYYIHEYTQKELDEMVEV